MRELVEQNEILSASTEALLRARAQLRVELAELDAKIADLAKQDDVCRLMMTMPGVGRIVALTVKAAIDDPTRFVRSKDVGPWVGLTPRCIWCIGGGRYRRRRPVSTEGRNGISATPVLCRGGPPLCLLTINRAHTSPRLLPSWLTVT